MSDSGAAPAQYKQASRKGKKAWRKNVDVTEIKSGLEEVRDQLIQGGVIAEKTADELFSVDVLGSAEIQKDVAKRHKPLKVDEILAKRSAVPAVSTRKRLSEIADDGKRKKAKISGKEYDRLRAIAYGGEQVKKDVVQTDDAAYDPWAVQEVKEDPRFDLLEKKKPKVEPKTLKHAPISQAKTGKAIPSVRKPTGVKSYNPNFDDWRNDLLRQGAKELEAEKKRLQEAREEAERMERAAAETESDSGEESVWESEWEGFSDSENKEIKKKRPERKSLSQRNKIKRRKEAQRKATHEAKMKAKEQQLQEVKRLTKSVEEKEKARAEKIKALEQLNAELDSEDDGEEIELRKKQFGKAPLPEAPLEVVTTDELTDSLRLVKPQGNLLKDRFRNMLLQGKVEARRQIPYGKQKKYTVSEKWSYKDWQLPK
ncbi:hypothetical protein CFE70_008169 [Pyrenophora teres f. teres 0-1]|uniref:Ribosome biogenesis protein NOP53 n=1 Tax=Pyrenophora teres f. teres (strain 0-1) TaxID=861557 RepID=E3S515_PYRTT|nr:hypothetical protein PTT_17691 [Pyrenophora teres f. teres 0-1]KAE8828884.1 hypothetical protein PTNB85_08072 [Pyrenophora teres f. teres]KAE8830045.1 hypothetical protein HRS9139_06669 [Pyrenophora teres f. teres]KAE8841614.1 hypothetical protein HRS9122_05740 [Pyrenophora teres f. teres]